MLFCTKVSICELILFDLLESLWYRRGLDPAGIFSGGKRGLAREGLQGGLRVGGVGGASDAGEIFTKFVKMNEKITIP